MLGVGRLKKPHVSHFVYPSPGMPCLGFANINDEIAPRLREAWPPLKISRGKPHVSNTRISLVSPKGGQATLGISREILKGGQKPRSNFSRVKTAPSTAVDIIYLSQHYLNLYIK